MTTPIEVTIVASMQAEIERLQTELAQTKEAWHNQYTTAMHLSADLAEAKQYTLDDVVTAMIGETSTVNNTVESSSTDEAYIQIQDYRRGWHTLSQRFAMDEQQKAIGELAKWRERFPVASFRPVIVTVALLVPEEAPEQES